MHVWTGADRRANDIEGQRADSRLNEAIDRQLRLGVPRSVLVLHLSCLLPPAPHPHHRRVARLVLDDAAQLHGGQVFPRPNGDLVLISAPAAATSMMDTLTRLFRTDAPGLEQLFSLWLLPAEAEAVLSYAQPSPARRRGDAAITAAPKPDLRSIAAPSDIDVIGDIGALVQNTRFSDLARRQAAVQIVGDRTQLLFHEVSFTAAALHTGQSDPFLFRHLAARLDQRLLQAITSEMTQDNQPMAPADALHLNLTLSGIHSVDFGRFAEAAKARDLPVGIEVSLLEACADLPAFTAARSLLRGHGFSVVLDSVSHPALLLTTPEALEPDLLKLDWTPRLAALGAREKRQLTTALLRLDPARVILHRAESEAAIAWGRAQGIQRFQGRHVDAMLAAGRMSACVHAPGCGFRQCIQRAAATGPTGRAGCLSPHLLSGGGGISVGQP